MKRLLFIASLFFISLSGFSQSATDTLIATATPGANTTIVSYNWKQTSGAAMQKFSPTGNSLIFTITSQGDYTIDCIATDSEGQTVLKTTYVTAYIVGRPTMNINPPSSISSPIILKIK